jgi:hypothetical protein
LLALVFDERTSWSILSAERDLFAHSPFHAVRSILPSPTLVASPLAFTFSTVFFDLAPVDTARLHLRCISLENHSNTISDETSARWEGQIMIRWENEGNRKNCILESHGMTSSVRRINER